MWKKKQPVVKATSSSLAEESAKIVNVFESTVTQLLKVAQRAEDEKAAKEKEITELQTEAANLEAVSNKATTMANKISGLLQ